MTTALTLTPHSAPPPRPPRAGGRAPESTRTAAVRIAVHGDDLTPPTVHEVSGDPATVVEGVFADLATRTSLPVLALREIVENLVHARFAGATVTVLDSGREVRVSDCGPGIADLDMALSAGFSTADDDARQVIRGVGSGLPLAASLLQAANGELQMQPNLRGGLVVSLRAPVEPVPVGASALGDIPRRLLVLLLEMGPVDVFTLAAEIDLPLSDCGRELVLLEHRGLVARGPDGRCSLADAGTSLVATLF